MTKTETHRHKSPGRQTGPSVLPLSGLKGYRLRAEDGEIGKISDFLIEEPTWTLRYFVVNIGSWLKGRKIALDARLFTDPDLARDEIPIELTRKKIKDGPTLAEHEPVSRAHQQKVAAYFGWSEGGDPGYGGIVPMAPLANLTAVPPKKVNREPAQETEKRDEILRSYREIEGYTIEATDGSIGHVEDLLVEPDTWQIRYLVVDTRNWLPGRKVLVGITWLDTISYTIKSAAVRLKRSEIEEAPDYDPGETFDRAREERLHAHYQIPGYWP